MSIQLGPFLCQPTPVSMGFWCQLVPGRETTAVRIEVLDESEAKASIAELTLLQDSQYGIALGKTAVALKPGTKYYYRVFVDGVALNDSIIPNTERWFRTLPEPGTNANFSFALVSCNGIDDYEAKRKKKDPLAFAMWDQLNETLNGPDPVYLGILGGDQVYMDRDFRELKSLINKKKDDKAKALIAEIYLRFWSNPSYQKVMAKLPCLLMWDDHDLMDGFGSRLDQFNSSFDEEKDWAEYRQFVTRAFYEFQAIRNSESTPAPEGPFTATFAWDDTSFVAMDLRSERNAFKKTLLSAPHKSTIEKQVTKSLAEGKKHFFFVSPVTVARMGEGLEMFLGEAANYLWGSVRGAGWGDTRISRLGRTFFWLLFFGFAFCTMHIPLESNLSFFPAIVCLALGGLIAGLDRIRARLETRKGEPLEFGRILKREIKRADIPFRAYLRLLGIIWAAIGLAFLAGSMSYGEIAEGITKIEPLGKDFKHFLPIWITLPIVAASCLLGAFITTAPKPWKSKKWIMLVSIILTLVGLTWIGMPGDEIGLHMLIQFLAQLLVLFYLFLSILEAWGILHEVAGLDDDIKDGWSSPENRQELPWLLKLIKKIKVAPDSRAYILAGDIHTGGVTKLFFQDIQKDPLYQVVSSPIAYPPMPGLVERFTGSDRPIRFELEDKSEVEGINYFYNCSRNFAVIRSISANAQRSFAVEFTFENLKNIIRHPLGQ